MNRKAFTILIGLAAVLIVIAVVGRGPGSSESIAGASAGELLLPGLAADLDSVAEINIYGPERARLVSLWHDDDAWTVAELDGYAADRAKVGALLIALSEARIVEEKTSDPAFYSRLGVEDLDSADAAGLGLALTTTSDWSYALILGDAYTGGQRYARIADEPLSLLIDTNPDIAEDPSDWVVTEIISLASNRVQRVAIEHADGERLVLSKAAQGDTNFAVDGIPEGRELQYAGVANVTGNLLQNLRLDDVRQSTEPTTEAASVTEYFTFDGLVVAVSAYREDDASLWLSFAARYDPDQALDYAGEVESDIGDSDAAAPGNAAADDAANQTAIAEAEQLNNRLGGWQFRIPSYQEAQLMRRLEELLQPVSDE